jgi:glycosyltransferase involved in cell wall biosynthesis
MITSLRDRPRQYRLAVALVASAVLALAFVGGQRASPLWLGLLLAAAGGLALDGSVHLTGYVADVRIPVAEAAVCVVPIRQGGGTRLKILEAIALGTPVVATAKGAEGLDVIDGEHLLLADTPQAFAAATLRLLGDPTLRARLASTARRLVETTTTGCNWDSVL